MKMNNSLLLFAVLIIVLMLSLIQPLKLQFQLGGERCPCGKRTDSCPYIQCTLPGLMVHYHHADKRGNGNIFRSEVHNNKIHYNWGSGNVLNSKRRDRVKLLFRGLIKSPVTGPVYFRTRSDDGIRLTINKNRIINQWRLQGPTRGISAAINMVKEQNYPFALDWYEYGGGAMCQLEWKYGNAGWHPVPKEFFFHKPKKQCLVRMPSGCNRRLAETKTPKKWFIDPHGKNRGLCLGKRKGAYRRYCGRNNSQHKWN